MVKRILRKYKYPPDLQITVEHIVAEADWVMAKSRAIATHGKAVLGVPPSNKKNRSDILGFASVQRRRADCGDVEFDGQPGDNAAVGNFADLVLILIDNEGRDITPTGDITTYKIKRFGIRRIPYLGY